jgi:hypothetical protein
MVSWWRTCAAAVVCVLPGVALVLGGGAVLVTVLVAVAAAGLAVGWPWLADIPALPTAIVLLVAAGAATVIATTLMPDDGPWLAVVILAVSIPVAFVREIARPRTRDRLVESVSAIVTGLAALAGVSLWVGVARADSGPLVALVAGIIAAIGVMVARPWHGDDAGPAWADCARLTLPMAVVAPVAWVATVPFG